MKQVFRVILLILALISLPISIYNLYSHVNSVFLYLHYVDVGVDETVFNYGMPKALINAFISLIATVYTVIYVAFTLKNGFGKTLYSTVALGIEDLRAAREERRKKRKREKITQLQTTLDKLNQDEEND